MAQTTSDYRKQVTERLIGMLESGTAPWQKPWDAGIAAMNRPHNFNGRPYHGVNALMLWCTAIDKGYEDPRWLTFNQVQKLGGRVNKGEKSQLVEYWQWEKEIENPDTGEKEKVPLPHPKVFRAMVFNADQCSGLPPLERPIQQWTPHERADRIVAANGVQVMHSSGEGAFYSPGGDYICLPPKESFPTEDAYYSTLLHEVGHSTGHPARLNREFSGQFGSENYAKEELRAELASTFLCGELGIATTGSDEQHAAYVKSWVSALRNDYNEIFRAVADAEKICNYLYDREKEYLKNMEQNKELLNERLEQVQQPVMDDDGLVVVQMAQTAKFRGKIAIYSNNTVYMGDSRNYLYGTYDNGDNSLVFVSRNPLAFDLVTGRDYPDSLQKLMERGKITAADLQEMHRLNARLLVATDALQTAELSFKGVPFDEHQNIMRRMTPEEFAESKGVKNMDYKEKMEQMPASDAQKGLMVSLDCRFSEDITKGEADRVIKEQLDKREKHLAKMNEPATKNQLQTLKENDCNFDKKITVGEASKMIGQLPATAEQKKYMDKLKIEYDEKVTRNGAVKLIEKKMREFEERDNQPATQKQLAAMKERGLEPAADTTKGEARAAIYLSPATEKQLNFLNINRIDYDAEKICFGRAAAIISKIQAERSKPATREQLMYLDDLRQSYAKDITKGEAYKLIRIAHAKIEKVTDEQLKLAAKLEIKVPENIKRSELAQLIDTKMKENAIANYVAKESGKENIEAKYMELAKQQYEKSNDFSKTDDKAIAKDLLSQGFDAKAVKKVIIQKSPVSAEYDRASRLVEAAAKEVKPFQKVTEAEMGR